MNKLTLQSIQLKSKLSKTDYEKVKQLQKTCMSFDQVELKLELEYKLNRENQNVNIIKEINEFMYWTDNTLVGYIGICGFGDAPLEITGMVHPDYRRLGIFSLLFQHVEDECARRTSNKRFLLCDRNALAGQSFLKKNSFKYDNSEYEMVLNRNYSDISERKVTNNITLRKANNDDLSRNFRW